MNIAYNTLSENPFGGSGSFDYFKEMAILLQKLDSINSYYFIYSVNNKRYFKNNKTIYGGISNEHQLLRILSEQTLLPFSLLVNSIDVLFTSSSGGIAPYFLPKKIKLVLGIYATHHLKSRYIDFKKRLYRNTLLKRSIVRSDIIIVNSNVCKNDVLELGFVDPEKIHVIYHGIDERYFNNSPLSVTEIKYYEQFNIRAPYILFVSIIYPYKNLHILMEAFGKFIQEHKTDHDLVIIGNFEGSQPPQNEYYQLLNSIAAKYDIQNRIKYLGKILKDKLRPFYKNADVYVQTSLYETFGKTTIEAMSCGCPVIGSQTSATPEILDGAGLLYDPDDPDALKNRMEDIIFNDSLKNNNVQKGVEKAKAYSLTQEVKNYISIFNILNN